MQFKSIPFRAKVKQSASTKDVANQLQSLIDAQATNGWSFETVETVKTIIQPTNGCFGLGAKPMYIDYCSVATFTKSGVKAAKAREIEEINAAIDVPHETSVPLVIHQATVVTEVVKALEIEEEIVAKDIDYSAIFSPTEKPTTEVLNTKTFETPAVQEPFVAESNQVNPIIEWVELNKNLVIFAALCLLASFLIYKALQPKPEIEAKKAVEMACKCEQDKTAQLISNLTTFSNSFYAAQFPTQIEARNAYNNAISGTMASYSNCKNQEQNYENTLRNKFSNYEAMVEFDNIFNYQFNTSYKGDMTEYWRIAGIVEGQISMLKADYSVIENVVQTLEQPSLTTNLDALTGILTIEPPILNVRDKPNVDEGTVIFKAESGMRYSFVNQFTDDNGVTWYNIEMNGQNGWVSGLYAHIEGIETSVLTATTSFHTLNYNTLQFTKERAYLEVGQTLSVFKKFKEFVYTEYTNVQGKTTKGWLLISDLKN